MFSILRSEWTMILRKQICFFLLVGFLPISWSCSSTKSHVEGGVLDASEGALDRALSHLTVKELDQAALVFRVAYDKSLETWQGPSDLIVAGCTIGGNLAEKGLSVIRPWLDQRVEEEARRISESVKEIELPIDRANCTSNCSCGLGLRILEAPVLEGKPLSRSQRFKKLRRSLEAQAELITAERAEYCTESMNWVCESPLLKELKKQVKERSGKKQ